MKHLNTLIEQLLDDIHTDKTGQGLTTQLLYLTLENYVIQHTLGKTYYGNLHYKVMWDTLRHDKRQQ